MISFLSLCLLSRFERYQRDGGPPDFSKYMGSLLDSIIENIEESRGLRFPRMTGPQKAAKASRDKKAADAAAVMEQAELLAQRIQSIKLTASSVSDIGYQVLFLFSSLRDFLFPV